MALVLFPRPDQRASFPDLYFVRPPPVACSLCRLGQRASGGAQSSRGGRGGPRALPRLEKRHPGSPELLLPGRHALQVEKLAWAFAHRADRAMPILSVRDLSAPPTPPATPTVCFPAAVQQTGCSSGQSIVRRSKTPVTLRSFCAVRLSTHCDGESVGSLCTTRLRD